MNTESLRRFRQEHETHVQQQLSVKDKRIKRYETIICHLVDVVERKQELCHWLMQEARTAAARAQP